MSQVREVWEEKPSLHYKLFSVKGCDTPSEVMALPEIPKLSNEFDRHKGWICTAIHVKPLYRGVWEVKAKFAAASKEPPLEKQE